jgi:hypothetical protein
MNEPNHRASHEDPSPENFESDINQLITDLKKVLGEGSSRWYYDEHSETLYIELESLSGKSEAEIENKAGSILDECDIDFEEIILLPLSK